MTVQLTPEMLKNILSEAMAAAKAEQPILTQPQETSYQVRPPEEFNFKDPLLWRSWIRRFNMFRTATGLSLQSDVQQISMLLYCMGQDADDLLTSIGLDESKRTSYDNVVKEFDKYFLTKKNIFYQRAMFIQHNQ